MAKKLLAEAGYPRGFKTNVVADAAADLGLLQVIKTYFAAVGIDMDIRTLDSAAFIPFVETEKKHGCAGFPRWVVLCTAPMSRFGS